MGSLTPAPAAAAFAPPVPLEVLAERAFVLQPAHALGRRDVLRDEASMSVDRLLARVARGRGALDVALAEGLAALSMGDRFLRLGYSGGADYARERLGIAGRTAQAMVQLGRGLGSRPLLRSAVRRGEVSTRKAQVVLSLAIGDAEAAWVERARGETVRALEAAVREAVRERDAAEGKADVSAIASVAAASSPADAGASAGAGATTPDASAGADAGAAGGCTRARPSPLPAEEDEEWERISFGLSPEDQAKLDQAMALAGRLLGAAASPKWQRLEVLCQEYVGAHPQEAEETERTPLWPGGPPAHQSLGYLVSDWLGPLKSTSRRR
jgi:hypothetical protein